MNVTKKIIISLILLAVFFVSAAQEISIRGGLNLSQMLEKLDGQLITDDPKLKSGFSFGPTVGFPINKFLSFETGILYSSKGLYRKGTYGPNEPIYSWLLNIAYLETPLSIKAKLHIKNFEIFGTAGGYFASGLYGSLIEREDISNKQGTWYKVKWDGEGISINRIDYGLDLGIGAKLKTFELGICYQIGIANLTNTDSKVSGYNRNIEVYFKYQLWNKI